MTPRRWDVLTPSQSWREIAVAEIRSGDIVRLFEADGSPVADAETGALRFRAMADAGLDPEDSTPVVETEPIPETDVEREAGASGMWWPGGGRQDLSTHRSGNLSGRARGAE